MSLQRGKEFGICSFFFSLNVGTKDAVEISSSCEDPIKKCRESEN